MTNRVFHAIVVITAVLVATGVPRAQTPAAAPAPAQSPAPSSPPALQPSPQTSTPAGDTVYVIGRDRIAPPRALQAPRPGYTPEAIRNRIQGTVRMQGVVERDGTISGITIVQSLDSQFGLDQAALDTLKQWRFQPGTLVDGTPVRVLINVDLTFTLRDAPLTQGWPEGFVATTASQGAVAEVADAQGLRLTISRPAAWIRRPTRPSEWLGLNSADSTESVGVFRPDTAAFDLTAVAPEAQAPRLLAMMRQLQASPQVETLGTGQVQPSPGVSWLWSAFRMPNISNLPGAPQSGLVGDARVWAFVRTVNGKVVLVQCVLLLPRDVDPAVLPARIQQAAADFAPIVKSISVEAIQN